MHSFPVAVCLQIYTECACQVWGFINILGSFSVYLQHLQSWCLQRSTQTKGGEQWCFLQASEEQPMETPFEVTTWSSSEVCSRSRGIERLLNLTSRTQPGTEGEKKKKRRWRNMKKQEFTILKDALRHQSSGNIFYGHIYAAAGVYTQKEKRMKTHKLTRWHTCRPMHMQAPLQPTHKQPKAKLSAWTSFFTRYFLCWLVCSLCGKHEA